MLVLVVLQCEPDLAEFATTLGIASQSTLVPHKTYANEAEQEQDRNWNPMPARRGLVDC